MGLKSSVQSKQSTKLHRYKYPLFTVLLVVCCTVMYINFGSKDKSHAAEKRASKLSSAKYANGHPGGVNTNLLFWLKADTGWTSSSWNDMSGNSQTVTEIGNPTYESNVLNGSPGIYFDGNDAYYVDLPELRFKNGNHHITLITVYHPTNSHVNQGVMGAMYKKDNNTIMINKQWYATGNGAKIKDSKMFQTQPHLVSYIINEENNVSDPDASNQSKRSRVYIDGDKLGEKKYNENKDQSTDGRFYIGKGGAHGSSRFLNDGYIYEVIIFENSSGNISTTMAEIERIESYLAIKYGITVKHNLLTALGVVVWDKALNNSYHYDIAALARDDASGLYKDTSMSWQSNEILKVMAETVIDDEEYLVWGSNNKTSSSSVTWAPPPGIVSYLHRQWKFESYDANGNDGVGLVSLEFDLSGLSVTAPDEIALIVDTDDGDMSNATVLTNVGTYNGTSQKILFTGINVNDGDWITLGSKTGGNSLPIQLVDFNAYSEANFVQLKWTTASEIDNDYFTVERSVDMTSWNDVTMISGAGTSTQMINYKAVDDAPLDGVSYYRLKQTDFNGEFSYSDVVNVKRGVSESNEVEEKIKLYPNPAMSYVTLELEGQQLSGSEISISNAAGQLLHREFVKSAESKRQLNVDKLFPGLYFVTVSQNNEKFTAKLIIR